MYEAAIQALLEKEPERAILLITREMRKTQEASELFELEIMEAVKEIKHIRSTEFLDFPMSFENACKSTEID
jgi:hypothetical protein